MKISPIKTQSFKGHGAGKIKALYMQNAFLPAQIPVYNELRQIGKAHNFDVFIHNQDTLHSERMNKDSDERCAYEIWAQDNKTILKRDGQTVIISGVYMPKTEEAEAKSLSRLKKIPHEKAELFLEGGNFFIGKKADGKRYLIVGSQSINVSALHHYLKDKKNDITKDDIELFAEKYKLRNSKGEVIATFEEFNDEFEKWKTVALEKFQETFDVEKDDITIISQGEYHNDLAIRPLNYPYVLVNDEEMSKNNIKRLENKFKLDAGATVFAIDMKSKLKTRDKKYATCDRICNQLEKNGFIPIRIGGGYGANTINFINAIVHQNGDDLIYITNSAESGNKYYEYLQTLFESALKEKCPQITKIYFVKGALAEKNSNIILEYLKRYKGGIHCLCSEEMEE